MLLNLFNPTAIWQDVCCVRDSSSLYTVNNLHKEIDDYDWLTVRGGGNKTCKSLQKWVSYFSQTLWWAKSNKMFNTAVYNLRHGGKCLGKSHLTGTISLDLPTHLCINFSPKQFPKLCVHVRDTKGCVTGLFVALMFLCYWVFTHLSTSCLLQYMRFLKWPGSLI